jgi:cohesin complex subunit SA-1/2
LFDEESSSEEEDSISGSDREDAHDEEEKQEEEEEEEAPLIHSIRSSSKLRSLKLSRDENKGQRKGGSASRTSGA